MAPEPRRDRRTVNEIARRARHAAGTFARRLRPPVPADESHAVIPDVGTPLPTPAGNDPLAHCADLLPRRRDRGVVLADDTLRRGVLRRYLAALPGTSVTMVGGSREAADALGVTGWAPSESAADDVTWFVRHGPVDVVIDMRRPRPGDSRRARWTRLFLHLRPGGLWLAPRQRPNGDVRTTERAWLAALAAADTVQAKPSNHRLADELMRAVSGVRVTAGLIAVGKQLTHVVKLRDDETDEVWSHRDPQIAVEILSVIPAQTFHSPAKVRSHEATVPITGLETDIDVPRMSLRHYTGPIAFSGHTLLASTYSVPADSFRFYHALDEVRGKLANPNLFDFDARLARVKPENEPIESLVGTYYLIDPQTSNHFGHVMTEMLARLWGWDEAKRRFPDLKAILWAERENPIGPITAGDGVARLERPLLNAYGIADEDIVVVDRPAFLHSVVAATLMWHNWPPFFAHPQMADVWRRLADNVGEAQLETHERIFVSRRQHRWRRRCINGPEVEEFFAEQGFTVVYPEDYTLAEQAALFGAAEVIAGYGGSALFNVIFARNVKTVIIINQESYTARNEHLFTAVLGCEVHYFWSTALVEQPEDGWRLGAYQSEFEFDFDRNGRALRELIASL